MDKNTAKDGTELTPGEARLLILAITPDMVREVYSGKQGCMCGCLGKYSVNPAHKAEADSERGYEQPAGTRAMVMVRKVLSALQAHPNACIQDGSIVFIPRSAGEERNYVAYLCNAAAV
jgi:hypothetical protein